jgi:hypothetical protein
VTWDSFISTTELDTDLGAVRNSRTVFFWRLQYRFGNRRVIALVQDEKPK